MVADIHKSFAEITVRSRINERLGKRGGGSRNREFSRRFCAPHLRHFNLGLFLLALPGQRSGLLVTVMSWNVAHYENERQRQQPCAGPKQNFLPVALLLALFTVRFLLHFAVMLYALVFLMGCLPRLRFLVLPLGARHAAVGMLLYVAEAFVFAISALIQIFVVVIFLLVFVVAHARSCVRSIRRTQSCGLRLLPALSRFALLSLLLPLGFAFVIGLLNLFVVVSRGLGTQPRVHDGHDEQCAQRRQEQASYDRSTERRILFTALASRQRHRHH